MEDFLIIQTPLSDDGNIFVDYKSRKSSHKGDQSYLNETHVCREKFVFIEVHWFLWLRLPKKFDLHFFMLGAQKNYGLKWA